MSGSKYIAERMEQMREKRKGSNQEGVNLEEIDLTRFLPNVKIINGPETESKETPPLDERIKNLRSTFLQLVTQNMEVEGEFKEMPLLQILCRYFCEDETVFKESEFKAFRQNLSFQKGILIVGGYGAGKTLHMQTFAQIFSMYDHVNKYSMVSTMDICAQQENKAAIEKWKMKGGNLLIDDLGREEEEKLYSYGRNPIKDILHKRVISQRTTETKPTLPQI